MTVGDSPGGSSEGSNVEPSGEGQPLAGIPERSPFEPVAATEATEATAPSEPSEPSELAAAPPLWSAPEGTDAAIPAIPEPAPPRSRRSRRLVLLAAAVIVVGVLAFLAVNNNSVANRYHHLDSAEIALVHRLDTQVSAANSEIKSLNAQLASTENNLATVANQKAKEQDLVNEANQVAGDQNSCINRVEILGTDLSGLLNAGRPSVQVVQSDANQVSTVCQAAQQATAALQGTVNGQP